MRIVIVESPYRGDGTPQVIERNVEFAKNICRAFAIRGTVAFASHLYFTQFLEDTKPTERKLGIEMGRELGASLMLNEVVFCLRPAELISAGGEGASEGMRQTFNFYCEHQDETGYPEKFTYLVVLQDGTLVSTSNWSDFFRKQ